MARSRARWRRRLLAGATLLLLMAVVGGGVALHRKHARARALAALQANNRGVGHLEQFDNERAIVDFEEAARLAPGWLPAQINLGIALLNTDRKPELERAKQVFEGVLAKEPDNRHAHFCLGLLLKFQKDPAAALRHFEAVALLAPEDPSAWFFLGTMLPPGSERAAECYRKAHELDPYQQGALYQQGNDRTLPPEKRKAVITEFQALHDADWLHSGGFRYGETGRYAEAIDRAAGLGAARGTGPLPRFRKRELAVELRPGARWATAADFGRGEVAELRARVRARFGGTVAVLDYNSDGLPDLFLAGAVVEDGQVRDLLLRNEGDGRFKDMTGEVGLDRPHPTLGCCVADFDNDGHPDLLLTGAGSVRLFRNTGENTFEDVTADAGLDRCTAAYLGAAFVDLDHDGALDLLLCEYAATPADAVRRLRGETAVGGGRLAVYRNLGRLQQPGVLPGPARLDCCWEAAPDLAGLRELRGPVLNLASSDLRRGGAFDLLVLTDGAAPAVVVNDRLRRFHTAALPEALAPAGAWNGALVLDVNCDGRSDLLLAGPGAPPRLLLNRTRPGLRDEAQWFEAVALSAPPLIQAVAVDVDLDGWADVVGLSDRRRPVLLHNEGGRLVAVADALGSAGEWPRDLLALAALDADGRGVADLLAWSEGGGLLLYACADNGNHGLAVELACTPGLDRRTGHMVRCSADGSGAWVVAQAGEVWAGQENTTLSAGLGQSCQPLLLGLGRFRRPDVLRLRWPDGTIQAELGLPAGGLTRVERHTRRISWGGRPD